MGILVAVLVSVKKSRARRPTMPSFFLEMFFSRYVWYVQYTLDLGGKESYYTVDGTFFCFLVSISKRKQFGQHHVRVTTGRSEGVCKNYDSSEQKIANSGSLAVDHVY